MQHFRQHSKIGRTSGMYLLNLALVAGFVTLLAAQAMAQNLFAPAARVNDAVVTNYELEQRIKFLRLLNQPGDVEKEAINGLIDDRLRNQAAKAAGLIISEEAVLVGMEEFAARAELSAEEFVNIIRQGGIDAQSFRDFVRAGLVWREVVGTRFGPRVRITEAEIDRAIALSSGQSSVRVLLSEIIIPTTPDTVASVRSRAQRLSQITTLSGFASAARRNSASPSRGRGGRLDWLPIGNLPPPIRSQVLVLSPGEVTAPIDIPNAIAVFQLRAIEEVDTPDQETLAVEYAKFYIPGGNTTQAHAQAERVKDQLDTCDDLFTVAYGGPDGQLERVTLPVEEVPGDIMLELAKLDANEVSTALTRSNGETLMLLMLCGRVNAVTEDVSREEIRSQLVNQRLTSYADSLLAELRADATITYP